MEGFVHYSEFSVFNGHIMCTRDLPKGRITHHPRRRSQRLWRQGKPPVRWAGGMREQVMAELKKTPLVGEIGRYRNFVFVQGD